MEVRVGGRTLPPRALDGGARSAGRQEGSDHVIVLSQGHLRRILKAYLTDYQKSRHKSRTHLSLLTDCPEPRLVPPPSMGEVISFLHAGGLHHHYPRIAA